MVNINYIHITGMCATIVRFITIDGQDCAVFRIKSRHTNSYNICEKFEITVFSKTIALGLFKNIKKGMDVYVEGELSWNKEDGHYIDAKKVSWTSKGKGYDS